MRKSLMFLAATLLVLLSAAVVSIPFLIRSSVQASRLDLAAVARSQPNFSMAQRMAILRRLQQESHPNWKDISASQALRWLAGRVAAGTNGLPPVANFSGNLTNVAVASGHAMLLTQQSDCSLTLQDSPYTASLSPPGFTYTVAASTPHYEQILHAAAGLTTTGGQYAAGCGNTTVGTPSREEVGGATSTGLRIYGVNYYDSVTGQNPGFVVVSAAGGTFQSFSSLGETNNVVDLTVSDLNGDGNSDLVLVNDPVANTGVVTVGISLGKADGAFPVPTEITLPGNSVYSAVVDDFNGDGHKDIVVSSSQGFFQSQGTTFYINFLAGKGDGTFQAVASYTVNPPTDYTPQGNSPYFGLISADLRGTGHKDLITSTGIVLSGNGDGTFTQATAVAFPNSTATSQWGPSVAAGDFNKDGKLDLATSNGDTITIYSGKGDGTFTFTSAYASIDNMGYLVAQDIDGDGNLDLFSGTGNNGNLGSDKFDYNMGYALMGNGDGTFRGAAAQPFTYTGSNLADLNGDKNVDAIGANAQSFTSYLGNGKGGFTTGPSFTFSPVTISGQPYTLGLDSFSVGDINGDGSPDLVYLGTAFNGPNPTTGFASPGIFTATGKGDGSFNPPVFSDAPPFVAAPDFDVNPTIESIHLADINHDGKLDAIYLYNTASYQKQTYYSGIAVQLGNGDGTFKTTNELTQLYSGAGAANPGAYQIGLIGDSNKDSNPDLFILSGVSGNSNSFATQLFLGKGDGTFAAPATIAGVTPQGALNGSFPLTLADMNKDGIEDLVALESDATTTNLKAAIALGNGDGTFKAPGITTYTAQCFFCGLAVADFDGDGKLDIAVSNYIAGPQGSGISFGNGDGTLQTGGSAATSITPAQSFFISVYGPGTALDLNGDGKPDILAGNVVLLNQGVTQGGGSTGTVTTSTALSASASAITAGGSVTFTATVSASTGSGTPTGSVTFLDGAASLGTGTLNSSGIATFATTSLATGAHTITAQYSGDSTFAASTSTAVTVNVQAVTASFSLSASPTTLSITPGQSGTSTLSITGSGGFAQPVTFACSGLPSEAACSFSPATVTPGASAVTTTLTLSTTAAHKVGAITRSRAVAGMSLLSLLLFSLPHLKRRARWQGVLAFLLACVLGAGIVSCGGGSGSGGGGGGGKTDPGTPAGTSTVTVTATGGSLSKTATLQVTVP